jgi:hypothetical protein
MGGSDDGNAHASTIDMLSTDLGTGFLLFFSKQGAKFLQQSFGFFAEETIRRHHPWTPRKGKSADVARGKKAQGGVSSFSHIHGLLILCWVLWSGLTWRQHRDVDKKKACHCVVKKEQLFLHAEPRNFKLSCCPSNRSVIRSRCPVGYYSRYLRTACVLPSLASLLF